MRVVADSGHPPDARTHDGSADHVPYVATRHVSGGSIMGSSLRPYAIMGSSLRPYAVAPPSGRIPPSIHRSPQAQPAPCPASRAATLCGERLTSPRITVHCHCRQQQERTAEDAELNNLCTPMSPSSGVDPRVPSRRLAGTKVADLW
jgi:hypothetical protein